MSQKELEYYLMTISVCQVKCFGWWTRTKSVCELQHWQSAHPSMPRELCPHTHTHTHTHTQKPSVLSAWDLEMGAEACALVWRPDRAEAHTFGLRGALRTPELRGIKRAGWRSTTVLWTPLTRWRLMVENTDERKTSLVFQWKTIYTGSLSVPSGIK